VISHTLHATLSAKGTIPRRPVLCFMYPLSISVDHQTTGEKSAHGEGRSCQRLDNLGTVVVEDILLIAGTGEGRPRKARSPALSVCLPLEGTHAGKYTGQGKKNPTSPGRGAYKWWKNSGHPRTHSRELLWNYGLHRACLCVTAHLRQIPTHRRLPQPLSLPTHPSDPSPPSPASPTAPLCRPHSPSLAVHLASVEGAP
jgi:hypothetical protein